MCANTKAFRLKPVPKPQWVAMLSARLRVDYLRTANPMYVWRAIQLANAARAPIPAWVREYLGAAAAKIQDAATPTAIAAAIGFDAPKGPGGPSKRERARRHDRDELIVDEIMSRREDGFFNKERIPGQGLEDALAAVAARHGVSFERAQRICYRASARDKRIRRQLA